MKKLTLLFSLLLAVGFVVAQHTISITLVTDRYASETTYEVVNTLTNQTIASGGPWANLTANGSTNRPIADINVDGTGCYAFYIYDAYSDGICCSYGNGSYSVSYDGVVKGQGGSFGAVGSVLAMGEGCPANEIEIVEISTSPYVVTGQNLSIAGKVQNNGTSLTSFDVRYKINDGEFVAPQNVTCNLTSMGSTKTFTHNIPATFATDGVYTITVEVSNPNGVADDVSDNTLTKEFISFTNSVPKKVLMEHFSTGQCSNCPAATINLTTWTNARPNIIWITHHAGFYTDPYTVTENTELLPFFNDGGSTYAPGIMLDRTHLAPDGDPGPVFFPQSAYTPGLMTNSLAVPAFVSVNMEGIFNPVSRELTLTVSGELVGTVIDSNLRLSAYIVEDGLVGTQSGASGSYTHNHVMRDAISPTFGSTGVITSNTIGTTYTKTYTYTVNSSWVPANLSLIAFVNNWDPTNVNNRKVLNAEKISLTSLISSSSEDINAQMFMVFPNPANDVLNINFAEGANIQIINNLGQVVLNIAKAQEYNKVDVSAFPAGSYFVKITKDNSVTNHKVVLVK